MKISGHGPEDVWAYLQGLVGRESRLGEAEPTPKEPAPTQDRVALSDQARTVHEIRQAVDKAPEVRQERVEEVKAALQQGTYNVRGEAVADRMLRQHLVDLVL